MLAPISGSRRDGGSSFRALKNYLGFKKDPNTGELARRSELLISDSLLSERTAQAEMKAVASENLRVNDPVYHYQLCWQEGEQPSKAQWKAAAEKSIRSLGFEAHQYVIAPHTDTDHFHVHIMVNRVHPETYRAHYPEFSKRTLDQTIREIEAEQGWKESKGLFRWDLEQNKAIQNTPDEMRAAQREGEYKSKDKRANKLEVHTDTESLQAYAKGAPAKELAELMKSSRSITWLDIHTLMSKYGLEVERGDKSGYKIRAIGTDLRVKASSAFRETFAGKANRSRVDNLDGWESKSDVRPMEVYKPRPLKRDPAERAVVREKRADERKALRRDYEAYRAERQAEQKTRLATGRAQLKEITATHREHRNRVRETEPAVTSAQRKAALSLLAMKAATDREPVQAQLRKDRAATEWKSYRDWVTDQAHAGRPAAISQLRGFLYSEKRPASRSTVPAVLVIESPDENVQTAFHPLSLAGLDYLVDRRNGDVRYGRDGELLFIDQGSKISLFQENESAYVAALQLGQAKFGNRLHVTGSAATKKAFALAAAKHNLRIDFTDDQMNDLMREARPTAAPPIQRSAIPDAGHLKQMPPPKPVPMSPETEKVRKRREATESVRRRDLKISSLVQMSTAGQRLSAEEIGHDMTLAREGLLAGVNAHELGKKIADLRGLKDDRIYAFDLVRSVQRQISPELEIAFDTKRGIER
jgi:hypothetical protein